MELEWQHERGSTSLQVEVSHQRFGVYQPNARWQMDRWELATTALKTDTEVWEPPLPIREATLKGGSPSQQFYVSFMRFKHLKCSKDTIFIGRVFCFTTCIRRIFVDCGESRFKELKNGAI